MIERERIEELVVQELDEANEKYPLFHSPHEAYAVIKEEVDELTYEVKVLIDWEINNMWREVKSDRSIEDIAKSIYNHAIFAAQEAIQVAAMAEKIKQSNLYEE